MPFVKYNLHRLETSLVKSLVWEAMRSKWNLDEYYAGNTTYRASFIDICRSVADLAVRKGKIEDPKKSHFRPISYTPNVSAEGIRKIGSILWSLVSQEILYIDLSNHPQIFFDITEYGLQVLDAGYPIPHDPDGFLAYLKSEIPNINHIIYTYMEEGVKAYNHRLYLSATTAIGCASEKAFLLLLDAYIQFLSSQKERNNLSRSEKTPIKRLFDEFQKSFNAKKGAIEDKEFKELIDGIDTVFSGVFEFLRQNRNSTGHPTGKSMPKEQVFISLQMFIVYCKRIYKLIDFFQKNKKDVIT